MTTPTPLSLSVYIIARNEADRIGRAIESAQAVTADVVVVEDGQSTDDTVAVARAAGARVFINPWPGFGAQKYFAESQCHYDWVLCLDADEMITPELGVELRTCLATPGGPDFYKMKVIDVYPGAKGPRSLAKPVNVIRLFRKSRGRTNQSPVHDRVDVPHGATVGQLSGAIWHYSIRSLDHLIKKYDAYTTLQAQTLTKRRGALTVRLFTEYPMAFFQYYILHCHFTGGLYGYALSRVLANARWQRILKMWEQQKTKNSCENR